MEAKLFWIVRPTLNALLS